jgi:hypothetical protein
MTDQGTQGQNQDRDNVDYEDQDAEPSLKAPGDAGPTGVVATGGEPPAEDTPKGDRGADRSRRRRVRRPPHPFSMSAVTSSAHPHESVTPAPPCP